VLEGRQTERELRSRRKIEKRNLRPAMTRAFFIQISIALLTLLVPEIWKDTFEWLRRSEYWRAIQIAVIIWIVIVVCVSFPKDWLRWSIQNRSAATIIFAIIGAFLFGGGFLVVSRSKKTAQSSQAYISRKQGEPTEPTKGTNDLRISVTSPPEYDEKRGIATIKVAFMNAGTVHRQILGYDFQLMQEKPKPPEPGKEESRAFMLYAEDAPLRIASKDIETATYKQQIPSSDLLQNSTSYINLKIRFLSEDGKLRAKTIDNVMFIERKEDGVSVGMSSWMENISLDEGASQF
jgi:hypothetical protein